MSTRQASAKDTSLTVRRAGAPIPVGQKSSNTDEIIKAVKGEFSKTQITDPFSANYGTADGGDLTIVAPPMNPAVLLRLTKENSTLKQLIEAMVTNVCGHGHRLEYIGPEDTKESDLANKEMEYIKSFLDAPNDEYSMLELRRRVRWDMEAIGYAFIEVARDRKGRVSAAWHLPAHLTRICAADKEGVEVTMEFDRFGQIVRQKVRKHFRRFVQIKGTKKVYFKEFGDPRTIDPSSGKENKRLGFEESATEVIHIPLYHAGELYGLPRWINNTVAITGARQAELTNLDFFSENAIPALAVMVSGGGLTQASLDALEGHLTAIRGRQAMNRVMVLEAYADENAAAENGTIPPPKVDIKPLAGERSKDGLFLEYDKVQTDKIRSSFRLPPIFVGASEDYTHACYDEKTETLTDHGWITYDQYRPGMKLACVCPKTGRLTFEEPVGGILAYDFSGEMWRIRNKHVDMLVTPNHRMMFRSYERGGDWAVDHIENMIATGPERLAFADTVTVCDEDDHSGVVSFQVPFEPIKGGPTAPYDAPTKPVPGDLFARFLGYFVSEGWTTDNPRTTTHVGLCQLRGDTLDDIERVLSELDNLGFHISWDQATHRDDYVRHVIQNKGLRNWLRENCGTCSEDKRLPGIVWEMSARQRRILLEALLAGDGTVDRREGRTSRTYYTKSEVLAGQVQRLALSVGLSAKVIDGTRCKRVLISEPGAKRHRRVLKSKHITKEQYSGKVYCFSVPTGVFITRRNGIVAVQGNTANTSYEVAESQVFGPERVREDDIINRKILTTYGVQFWEVRSNPPRISDPQEVVMALTAFEQVGAMTPNIAIGLANELFDLDIEPISEEWGNFPFAVVQALAVQGKVTGWEDIIIEDPDQTQAQPQDHGNYAPSDPGANPVDGQTDPNSQDQNDAAKAVVRQALLDLRDVVRTAAEAQRLVEAAKDVRERKRPEGA